MGGAAAGGADEAATAVRDHCQTLRHLPVPEAQVAVKALKCWQFSWHTSHCLENRHPASASVHRKCDQFTQNRAGTGGYDNGGPSGGGGGGAGDAGAAKRGAQGSAQELERALRDREGRPYPAYHDVEGAWAFPDFLFVLDRAQSDPYAAPSRCRVQVGKLRACRASRQCFPLFQCARAACTPCGALTGRNA